MAETLPDDAVREILLRVATDAAALFRCAVTCKLWHTIVFDLSFLRNCWPEKACHPSSLLGFFDTQRRDNHQRPALFFNPVPPAGSVLGARRRLLTSFVVSGSPPGDNLDHAKALATRGGLLLVRLAAGDPLRLAVCDLFKGSCDVLPPLECRASSCHYAVLTREDCCSMDEQQQQGRTPMTGYSAFFKVLAIVMGRNNWDCNLIYTFSSSSDTSWSEPGKCFDEAWLRNMYSVQILDWWTNRVVVCHGMAFWLGSYSPDRGSLPRLFTFGVSVKTGRISITELSIPTNQFSPITYCALMLSVAVDGRLCLLHMQKKSFRLNMWTEGDDGAWLLSRVIELKPPKQVPVWNPVYVGTLSGEKSGALFMTDVNGRAHKTDPVTGVMDDVTTEMFQGNLCTAPVPIKIDWPAFFMSRLAK